MEYLLIHFPHEAALGGSVQFRWMYQFERFMKNLKGKAKNIAKVEGSIVAGSLTEKLLISIPTILPQHSHTEKGTAPI